MDDRSFTSHPAGELAPALAQALSRLCEAEGVALAQVRSVEVDDGEISVRIERLGRQQLHEPSSVIWPISPFGI